MHLKRDRHRACDYLLSVAIDLGCEHCARSGFPRVSVVGKYVISYEMVNVDRTKEYSGVLVKINMSTSLEYITVKFFARVFLDWSIRHN